MSALHSLFDSYSKDHQDPTNRAIHWICVPLIVWSVIALLWCVPAPTTLFRPGIYAAVAMLSALMFYYKGSRVIGLTMLIVFVLMAAITSMLFNALGTKPLATLAVGVFVVAWIGQFLGHKIEGRRPSFLTDLKYLLVGPAWLMSKFLDRIGVKY